MKNGDKDGRIRKIDVKERVRSFKNAFSGLKILISYEHNFRIHIFIMILAVAAGIFFKISAGEWVAIILSIGFVLAFESVNTAVEYLADVVSGVYNERIKRVKDVAAAGVLISAIAAIITGLIIFLPKVFSFF